MTRKIKLIIGAIVTLATILSVPFFVIQSKDVQERLSSHLQNEGFEINTDEKIHFSLLPSPKVTISNVKFRKDDSQLVSAKRAEFFMHLVPLFKKEIRLSSVNIYNADISLSESQGGSLLNCISGLDGLINQKINFYDSSLSFSSGSQVKKIPVRDLSYVSSDKENTISAKLLDGDLVLGIDYHFSKPDNRMILNVLSKEFDLKISADKKSEGFVGSVNGALKANSYILADYLSKVYFLDSLINKTLAYDINIEGDLTSDQNLITIDKIKIKSDKEIGTASITLPISKNADFLFKFNDVDFDSMFKSTSESKNNNKQSGAFSIANFNLNLTVDHLRVNNKEMNSFAIILNKQDHNFAIQSFQAKLNNTVDVKLHDTKNIVVNNEDVLVGLLEIAGNKLSDSLQLLGLSDHIKADNLSDGFDIKSKIIFAKQEITLSDMIGTIGNGEFGGRWTVKIDGDKKIIDADLSAKSIDVDKISFPTIGNKINTLLTTSNDNSYLAEYKWFRENNDNYNITFAVDDMVSNNTKTQHLSGNISYKSGILKVTNLNMNADVAKINKFDFILDTRALNPTFKMDAQADLFNADYFLGLLTFKPSTNVSDIQDNKPPAQPTANNNKISNWSNQPVNIFAFYKFLGAADISIKELLFGKSSVKNLDYNSEIKDGKMFINHLTGNILGGDLSIKGNYNTENGIPSISLSYSITSADLSAMAKTFSVDIADGLVSMSGNLYTKGNTKSEWIKNLNSTSKFAARSFNISGIDLVTLVNSIVEQKDTDKKQILQNINDSLEKGDSNINDLDGAFIIKDGNLTTQKVTFANDVVAGLLATNFNLSNMLMNTVIEIYFRPSEDAPPLVVTYNLHGDVDHYQKTINKDSVIKYLHDHFGISTSDSGSNSKDIKHGEDFLFKKIDNNDHERNTATETN